MQHSGYHLDFLPGADIQQKYDEFKSPGPGSFMVGSRWGITCPAGDTEDTADGNGEEQLVSSPHICCKITGDLQMFF
jgi:hypothetical protein